MARRRHPGLDLRRLPRDPAPLSQSCPCSCPSKRHRGDLGQIALAFAELAGAVGVWKDALKEVDMTESQVVNEWTADALLKGKVLATRTDLLDVVEGRFPGALPEEYRRLLETQDSLPLL